jgi:hypothetical protein
MDSAIVQDSYWYLDGEGEDARMKALCHMCARKQGKGWFWDGNLGYGDYDLFCSACRNAIHLRRKVETENVREGG